MLVSVLMLLKFLPFGLFFSFILLVNVFFVSITILALDIIAFLLLVRSHLLHLLVLQVMVIYVRRALIIFHGFSALT